MVKSLCLAFFFFLARLKDGSDGLGLLTPNRYVLYLSNEVKFARKKYLPVQPGPGESVSNRAELTSDIFATPSTHLKDLRHNRGFFCCH